MIISADITKYKCPVCQKSFQYDEYDDDTKQIYCKKKHYKLWFQEGQTIILDDISNLQYLEIIKFSDNKYKLFFANNYFIQQYNFYNSNRAETYISHSNYGGDYQYKFDCLIGNFWNTKLNIEETIDRINLLKTFK